MTQLENSKKILSKYVARKSYERIEVLEFLDKIEQHMSADDIYLEMKNAGSSVSRATVYSSLKTFVKCGIAKSYTGPAYTHPEWRAALFHKLNNLELEIS